MFSTLLTTTAAAHYVGLSKPTLERLRLTGGGPVYAKLTAGPKGAVRYRAADLDAWIATRLIRHTSEQVGQ